MTNDDLQEFTGIFCGMCEVFGIEPSKPLIQIWWRLFRGVELEDFSRAVTSFIAEDREFMPKPGQVLQRATGTPSADEKALFAWQTLRDAVQRCGPYKTVSFADVAINAAVRCQWGTWPCLCDRLAEGESQEHWVQKQFVAAYAAVQARGIGDEQAAPLAGLSQVSVRSGQLVPPEPVMIGQDVAKRLTGVS